MRKEFNNQVEEHTMNQTSADWVQVYKTMAFDLPRASLRWAWGATPEKEAMLALWQGYDAGVRLASATVDSLYRSPALSEAFGRTINQLLRLQQLNTTATSFVASSLRRPPLLPEISSVPAPAAVPPRATVSRVRRRKGRHPAPVQTSVSALSQSESLRVAA